MVDAVHDEQHLRWLIADVDLAPRREGPVESRYCDRTRRSANAGAGASGWGPGYRKQVFAEEREERGHVRRCVLAH